MAEQATIGNDKFKSLPPPGWARCPKGSISSCRGRSRSPVANYFARSYETSAFVLALSGRWDTGGRTKLSVSDRAE